MDENFGIEPDTSGIDRLNEKLAKSKTLLESIGSMPADQLGKQLQGALRPALALLEDLTQGFQSISKTLEAQAGSARSAGAKVGAAIGSGMQTEVDSSIVKIRASLSGQTLEGPKLNFSSTLAGMGKMMEAYAGMQQNMVQTMSKADKEQLEFARNTSTLRLKYEQDLLSRVAAEEEQAYARKIGLLNAMVKDRAQAAAEELAAETKKQKELSDLAQLEYTRKVAVLNAMVKDRAQAAAEELAVEENLRKAAQADLLRSLKNSTKAMWTEKEAQVEAEKAAAAQVEALRKEAQADLLRSLKNATKALWAEKEAQVEAEKVAAAQVEAIRQEAQSSMLRSLKNASKAMWAEKAQQEAEELRQHKGTLDLLNLRVKAAKQAASEGSVTKDFGIGQSGANAAMAEGVDKAKDLAKAKFHLGNATRDLHSGVRGLSSGFGAMWLTWGAIAPMFAGAAVSAAFVQTAKTGADVTETMARLRILGGASAQEVNNLTEQLLALGKSGPFGPREVAEAMKTLKLAGLEATEVAVAIKDVLNFSLAGDLGIKEAADALTTVSTAFGIQAQGYGYVSDTISKAAAVSKSSVEDMAASFKTASVINQQYGVSLEETAVGLSLLANAGIKGTAAGTSLRNMYADLSGRTKKASDELKALGVEAFDPLTGKMRETQKVFLELLDSLAAKKTPEGARKTLSRIFGERGEKEAFALFDALSKKAEITGADVRSVYAKLMDDVVNAAGFSAEAAAELALTPLNQMKATANTLQSVLVETFDEMQPYLLETAAKLREIFNSDGFKQGLKDMVELISSATLFVVEHVKALTSLILAYTGLRAVITVISGVSTAILAWKAAAGGAAAATTALGLAARTAAVANPVLTILSGLIMAASAAWGVYEMMKGRADDKVSSGFSNSEELIKNLDAETARVDKLNVARARGISLQQLEMEYSTRQVLSDTSKAVKDQEGVVEKWRAASADSRPLVQADNKRRLAVEEDNLRKVRVKAFETEQAIEKSRGALEAAHRQSADAERREAIERQALWAKQFKGSDGGDGLKNAGRAGHTRIPQSNKLEEIKKEYASEMSLITEQEAAKSKLLAASRDALIVNQGAFGVLEMGLIEATESKKLAAIKQALATYSEEYVREREINQHRVDTWSKRNAGKDGYAGSLQEQVEANKVLLDNAKNKFDAFIKDSNNSAAKIKDTAITRMALQAIALQGELNKLDKAYRDFTRSEAELQDKRGRQDSNDFKSATASPMQKAFLSGSSAETERLLSESLQYSHQIEETRKNLAGARREITSMIDDGMEATKGQLDSEAALNDILNRQMAIRDAINGTIKAKASAEGLRSQEAAMRSSLGDVLSPDGKKSFEDLGSTLTSSFGAGAEAIGKMVSAMGGLAKANYDYADQLKVINALKDDPAKAADAKILEAALVRKTEQAQVSAYVNMASAAKGYFKEGTSGYKALNEVEKALRTFQMVMSAKALMQDVAAIGARVAATVAGETAITGEVIASEVQRNAAKVPGVFMSFMSQLGPWGMAAAAAAVAAVLGNASGVSGNGAPDVAARQAANGTGTVLGDPNAKSKSIDESLKLLESVATPQLRYTSEMAASLRSINSGISELSLEVLKSVGYTQSGLSSSMGIDLSTKYGNTGLGQILSGNTGSLFQSIWNGSGPIGKLGNSLAGFSFGSSSSSQSDSGLSIIGTLADLIKGSGMRQYADVTTTTKGIAGGLFGGNSVNTDTFYKDLQAFDSQQIGKVFKGISLSLQDAAEILGQDSASVAEKIAGFVIDIPKLSLQGLSESDKVAAINAALSAQMDKMATSVLGGFERFGQAGEGYYQTLVRVASGVEQADYYTSKLGITATKLADLMNTTGDVAAELVRSSISSAERAKFGGLLGASLATGSTTLLGKSNTGIGGLVENFNGTAAELTDFYTQLLKTNDVLILTGAGANSLSATLLKAAGDLTTLSDNLNVYYDKFFTDAEKNNNLLNSTNAAFSAMGIKMPAVNDGLKSWFRAEIELLGAKDLTIESNAKAYTSALALAGAVDSLSTAESNRQALATSWADKAAVLQGTATTRQLQLQKDLAGTTDLAIQGLIRLVYGLEDAAAAAALTATWTDRLAVLQGTTTTRQQQLIKDLASTTDEATKDLIKSVYRMEDAKKLAETNLSWQNQLDVLLGNKTQLQVEWEAALAAATDDSTKALINAVFAQKSYAETVAQTTAAFSSGLSTLQSYVQAQVSAGQAIQNLLNSLKTSVNAGTSPQSRLNDARSQYLADLSAARNGDAEAYSRITNSAQTYMSAGSEMYASGGAQQAIIAQVRSELGSLPVVTKLDANIVALNAIEQAILATGNTTNAALQGLASAMAFGFNQLDADNNGLLTISEFAAVMAGKATDAQIQTMFHGLDLNGDGVVSRLEALIATVTANDLNDAARIATLISTTAGGLAALDLNTNGILTKTEFMAAMAGKATDSQLTAIWNMLDTKGTGTIDAIGAVSANTGATSTSASAAAIQASQQTQLQTDIKSAGADAATSLRTVIDKLTLANQTQTGMANTLGNISSLQGVIHSTDYATMIGYLTAINSALWEIHTYAGNVSYATLQSLNLLSAMIAGGSPITVQSAYRSGALQTFALGGLVNTPTYFGMGAGTGLMGEAGPEFIMPAARGADGRMGVHATFPGMDLMVASMQRMEAYSARQAEMLERLIVLEAEAANVSISKQERIAAATERSARQQQLEGARA